MRKESCLQAQALKKQNRLAFFACIPSITKTRASLIDRLAHNICFSLPWFHFNNLSQKYLTNTPQSEFRAPKILKLSVCEPQCW